MVSKKVETLKVKDLQHNLFVRKALNVDHAIYLGELLESGQELPPIIIARKGTVIDGRHRIEAYELNKREMIEAVRLDIDDEDELAIISAAYQANVGGALPPTREDTEHTVLMLLERGASKKSIAELLKLPVGLARKYVSSVESKQRRANLQRAASAVTEGGMTVPRAAEQCGVDPEQLKEFLGGGRRKKRSDEDIRRTLTQMSYAHSRKVGALLKNITIRFEDGECTERKVREVFEHLEQLQRRSQRLLENAQKRFEAIKPAKKTLAS